MMFVGPEPADFDNVRALNSAFLELLADSEIGKDLTAGLADALRRQLAGLGSRDRQRLSEAPFLLMSLREHDAGTWQALAGEPTPDGLLAFGPRNMQVGRLLDAVIAFLWQLARRNAYAARLVSGAGIDWCEQLAEATLVDVIGRAAAHRDLLSLRFSGEGRVWDKLLGPGLSNVTQTRRAACLSVLQELLTRSPTRGYANLRSAACKSAMPVMRMSDRSGKT